MREPPWELPRTWPRSNRSSRATDRPRRARCQAVAEPMAPAPTTTTSARGTERLALEELRHPRHVAVLDEGVDRSAPVAQVPVEEVQHARHDRLQLGAGERDVRPVEHLQQ